jgi:transcriptional regulator with GAF, ATPase, and Fis domain
VWYQLFGQDRTATHRQRLDELAGAGIHAHLLESGSPSGPGLVFFHEVTRSLLDFVVGVSRGGLNRVLGVATTGAALENGAAWELLRAGSSDVFAWNHAPDPIGEIRARLERWKAVDRLVDSPLVRHNLVGRSPTWISVLRQVVEVASFTDSPVLITGASGTGKELIARLIHSLDPRARKRELVILDCATVVRELAGSEFFGHERGAYTGASGPRDGAFALADGGTLFLDEVGELPLTLQAQLLRVVQERTYKRVGGNRWHTTEFRLVCATNRPLEEEVAEGRFRADLYYRIASVVCHLPPLRDRPGDVIPLYRHFFTELHPERPVPELDEPVRDHLLRRGYPGNVRDLKQLVARIGYRHVGPGPITVGDLPEDERPAGNAEGVGRHDAELDSSIRRALAVGAGLKAIGKLATDTAIRIALDDEDGNLQRAAQRLGVTDRALQMRRAAGRLYGIEVARGTSNGVESESERGVATP